MIENYDFFCGGLGSKSDYGFKPIKAVKAITVLGLAGRSGMPSKVANRKDEEIQRIELVIGNRKD